MLAELYATGARKVPPGAPTGFVPARWAGYLDRRGAGRRRHRLPALLGAVRADGAARRAALRRHPRARVAPLRRPDLVPAHRRAVGTAAGGVLPPGRQTRAAAGRVGPRRRRAARRAWPTWNRSLADGESARSGSATTGSWSSAALTAEDVPAEAETCATSWPRCCPACRSRRCWSNSTRRTGFTDHLVHAGGKVARSPELKRNLHRTCLIAEATNMGLAAMAESCGHVLRRRWPGPPNGTCGSETLRGGQRRDRRLPPPAAAQPRCSGPAPCPPRTGSGSRSRASRVTARAPVPLFRPTAGHLDLHPCLRPAFDVRHQGHRGHRTGEPLRARRDARQRTPTCRSPSTPPTPTAPPWQLRPVRPGRQAALAPDPRPGQDHPLPHRARRDCSPPATRAPGRC